MPKTFRRPKRRLPQVVKCNDSDSLILSCVSLTPTHQLDGCTGVHSESRLYHKTAPVLLISKSMAEKVIMMLKSLVVLLLAVYSQAFQAPQTRLTTRGTIQTSVPLRALPDPSSLDALLSQSSLFLSDVPESAGISYSRASYYTVLALYLMSFPGILSTVKRSTSAKIKRKTFVSPGEKANSEKAMSLRQQAGEIMACTFLCAFLCFVLTSLPFPSCLCRHEIQQLRSGGSGRNHQVSRCRAA